MMTSLQAEDQAYMTLAETPDAGIYLPAPPDTASVHFATDIWAWQYGKTLRPTPRGEQASIESAWSAEEMMRILTEATGRTVSDKATPSIAHFIRRLTATAHWAPYAAKAKYMRVRPFARMNEHLASKYDDEASLRKNGSYPSGHTSLGWLVALAMTEVAPEYADTILRRGYQYGEDRWIVGAHWRSDVQAGYLCSSAALARAHANNEYYEDLAAARQEWRGEKGESRKSKEESRKSKELPVPDGLRIMETPIDTASFLYYDDLMGYYEGKALRHSSRGQRAIQGAAKKTKDLMRYFSPSVDITISKDATPALYALLDYSHAYLKQCTKSIKSRHPRKRPFVQFGEHTLMPELEGESGQTASFPSGHSTRGWGFALILAEVMPACSNAIFATGYEYGYDRVVAGYHYLSDVQAARLVASYGVAYLHTDEEFCRLMEEAKKEYHLRKTK
jgi:acid phosphatase (class A)